jgi:hypothetical protein
MFLGAVAAFQRLSTYENARAVSNSNAKEAHWGDATGGRVAAASAFPLYRGPTRIDRHAVGE